MGVMLTFIPFQVVIAIGGSRNKPEKKIYTYTF